MKEHPILFSGAMVRAILEGRKTQTRRVVKGTALDWLAPDMFVPEYVASPENFFSRYGYTGDRLWVRETFAKSPTGFIYKADFNVKDGFGSSVVDLETGETVPLIWKPSIHMPRAASRINLEVVNVRIERLHSITRDDVLAEGIVRTEDGSWLGPLAGVPDFPWAHATEAYASLWDDINAKRGFGWNTNPWVWVIEFKRVEQYQDPGVCSLGHDMKG